MSNTMTVRLTDDRKDLYSRLKRLEPSLPNELSTRAIDRLMIVTLDKLAQQGANG